MSITDASGPESPANGAAPYGLGITYANTMLNASEGAH
jgi:hypothetical protein